MKVCWLFFLFSRLWVFLLLLLWKVWINYNRLNMLQYEHECNVCSDEISKGAIATINIYVISLNIKDCILLQNLSILWTVLKVVQVIQSSFFDILWNWFSLVKFNMNVSLLKKDSLKSNSTCPFQASQRQQWQGAKTPSIVRSREQTLGVTKLSQGDQFSFDQT